VETKSKGTIIVVEDGSVVAMDLQIRLGRLGYDVIATVSNGEQAILQAG
jgi:CheY-like chemotaxis protein